MRLQKRASLTFIPSLRPRVAISRLYPSLPPEVLREAVAKRRENSSVENPNSKPSTPTRPSPSGIPSAHLAAASPSLGPQGPYELGARMVLSFGCVLFKTGDNQETGRLVYVPSSARFRSHLSYTSAQMRGTLTRCVEIPGGSYPVENWTRSKPLVGQTVFQGAGCQNHKGPWELTWECFLAICSYPVCSGAESYPIRCALMEMYTGPSKRQRVLCSTSSVSCTTKPQEVKERFFG